MIHRAAALLRKETAPTEPAEHAVVEKNARAVTDSFNSCAFSLPSRCVAMHLDVHKCGACMHQRLRM